MRVRALQCVLEGTASAERAARSTCTVLHTSDAALFCVTCSILSFVFFSSHATRAQDAADVDAASAARVRSGGAAADAARMGYDIKSQKAAYGIPVDLEATNAATTQMVWGPGTFGYSKVQLTAFKMAQCPKLNMDKVVFDTANHGVPGGDNYGEGNLDVSMIASFGLNVTTIVSNTNTSSSTEEGDGFGAALLDFLLDLPGRKSVPQVRRVLFFWCLVHSRALFVSSVRTSMPYM